MTGPRPYPQVKVYGKSAGAVIEAQPNRNQQPTINIDIAAGTNSRYDWDRKLIFQLTSTELAELAALLLGLKLNVEFKREEKGLSIERQSGHLFMRASAGRGRLYLLPVEPAQVFEMSSLVLNQLQNRTGMRSQNAMLNALKGAYML